MISARDRLEQSGQRAVAIVLKVSERCNLACTYCYFFFGGDGTYLKHPPLMSLDTAQNVGAFLGEAASALSLDRIEIALHGGEPLLMKPARLAALVGAIRSAIDARCTVQFLLQTNGVLISPEWIDLFAREKIGVGVSIDGPRDVNDRYRVDKQGRGSFDDVIKGWKQLKGAAAMGLIEEPGILSVITKDTAVDTLSFFADELEARSMNFLLPDTTRDNSPFQASDIDHIGKVMRGIFDAWCDRKDPSLRVRFIRDAMLPMISTAPLGALQSTKEDLWRAATIASSGAIFVEDTLRGAFESSSAFAPDVTEIAFTDVLASPDWSRIALGVDKLASQCEVCRYVNVCRGGPMISRFSAGNDFDNPSVFCNALFAFYRHVEDRIGRAGRLQQLFLLERDAASTVGAGA